jgi:DNA-binding NtrC family response regulator
MSEGSQKLVYVVEDSVSSGALYSSYLEAAGYAVSHFIDGHSALVAIKEKMPDILVQDVCLPDISGMEVMRFTKARADIPVIIITANSSIDIAVEAMRDGGFDFIEKPFSKDRLIAAVADAAQQSTLDQGQVTAGATAASKPRPIRAVREHFVGESSVMESIYQLLDSAARSKASVFVTGESGTGKEVCAQALHDASSRASGPFIPVNCAAIPAELFESEIFGHEKGAFSGAVSQRKGAAELANGGTLFLDEIGEMDLALQAKLLRFLQTGTFSRVGGQKMMHSDIRIVCATNRDPEDAVRQGQFREDLYYRLNVIPVKLPPLRDRGRDIIALATHFLAEKSAANNKVFRGFTDAAMELLLSYEWPGNIRQLQNVIENIVVVHDEEFVNDDMLRVVTSSVVPTPLTTSSPAPQSLTGGDSIPPGVVAAKPGIRPLWMVEKETIESAIEQCDGNIPLAAACLGVSASTIYRKIKAWEKDEA